MINQNKNQINWIVIFLLMVISSIAGGMLVYFMTMNNVKTEIVQNSQGTEVRNEVAASKQKLPETCVDGDYSNGYPTPVITSMNKYFGKVGEKIEISGCNFLGFEADKTFWIENQQGVKGVIYAERDSNMHLAKITLKSPLCQQDNSYSGNPCTADLYLTSGIYKISSRGSNVVMFTISQ